MGIAEGDCTAGGIGVVLQSNSGGQRRRDSTLQACPTKLCAGTHAVICKEDPARRYA